MVRQALHYTLRKLWLALAVVLVLAAVVLSIVRYTLPYLDHYRDDIERLVAEQFNQDVRIGALSADWSAFGPSLVLQDIQLNVDDGTAYQLQISRTHLVLNLWQSLWQREWILEDFVLDGVYANVSLDWQLTGSNDGQFVDALEQLLLFQLESFQIINSEVQLDNVEEGPRSLHIEQLSWSNTGSQRQGTGRFRVSDVLTNSFNFVLNARGDRFIDMQGELYVEAQDLDLSSWVETVIDGVEITEARVNVNAWVDITAGQLGNAQVHFGENSLYWQRDGKQHALIASPVTWALWATDDGLLMSSEPLTITVDDTPWPVESVRWAYQAGQHNLHLQNLSFSETAPLWSLFGSPGAQIRDWFAGIQPVGLINDVQVQLSDNFDWSFYVRAEQLDWQAYQGVPGLSGLSFELWSSEHQGAFALRGDEVNVLSPVTYSDEQQLSQVNWSGYWHRLENGFRVALPQGQVRLADVALEQQFALTREHQQAPVIEWWLQGHSATLPVADALSLLPLQLGVDLTNYLQHAVVQGEVNRVNMLWRGEWDQFPYHHHDGIFMARVIANELDFKFQPDWPAVENTSLTLEYNDHNLYFGAQGGTLLDAQLIKISAEIPDLVNSQPWLLLEAEARGTATAAREVFQQSPLADSVGTTLEQLHSDDEFDGRFTLQIPLFSSSPVTSQRTSQSTSESTSQSTQQSPPHSTAQDPANDVSPMVNGSVRFNGQSLHLAAVELDFHDIYGELTFVDDQLNVSGMRAAVFELPIYISLQGASVTANQTLQARGSGSSAYALNVGIDNQWTQAELLQSPILSWLGPYAAGELRSDARFRLQIADGMLDYDWSMRNELNDLTLSLPNPMQRAAGNNEVVHIHAQGNEQQLQVQMLWPHVARFETELTFGADQFDRSLLEIGPNLARGPGLPHEGMDVFMDLEEFELGNWLGVVGGLSRGSNSGESVHSAHGLPWALPPLNSLQARLAKVKLFNQELTDVQLEGHAVAEGWNILAHATQGRARVHVPNSLQVSEATPSDDKVHIAIDYLNLDAANQDQQQSAEGSLTDYLDIQFFEQLPALHLVCELCRFDEKDLGRVEAILDPRDIGAQLTLLNVRRSGAEVNLHGGWRAGNAEADYVSYVNGWIAVSDVGNLVADFGKSSVVRDSSAQIELDLHWPGTPADFTIGQLNGAIDWSLGAGYLRDVSDGGARVFSLFSLESLMRKLTLDFRDIFARGMFYSSFRGTLNIDNGVVYTDDTRMNGSAGDLEVSGSTNLVSEALDYQLIYVPKVTSSLPVLVAWMVNPPTGLAAFLVDRVLHEAQVISRLEYSITGTVAEPIVNEEARAQREVELPEVESEQLQEEHHDAS